MNVQLLSNKIMSVNLISSNLIKLIFLKIISLVINIYEVIFLSESLAVLVREDISISQWEEADKDTNELSVKRIHCCQR